MSVFDDIASNIYDIVMGSKRRRIISTPIGLIVFLCFLTLLIFLGIWVDAWLSLQALAGWRYIVSFLLFFPGLLFAGWSVIHFFTARGTPVPVNPPPVLITTGLYRYVRNPMIIGLFLILEGIGFFIGSLSVILVFAPLPVLLYGIYIVTIEERELEMRFGDAYREYKKNVPRFLPRFR